MSTKGGDYSHWNGDPTFKGDTFAFLKCTEGVGYDDGGWLTRNQPIARETVDVAGWYHFGRDGGGSAQAKEFLDIAQPKSGELLALDWEWASGEMNATQAADFCVEIRSAWSGPLLVYSVDTFLAKYAPLPADVLDCDLWYVAWGSHVKPVGWTDWKVKQIGLRDGHDDNEFNGSLEDLKAYAGGDDMALNGKELDALAFVFGQKYRVKNGPDKRDTCTIVSSDGVDRTESAQLGFDDKDADISSRSSQGEPAPHSHPFAGSTDPV
jgi:hypothetical protein